MEIKDKWVDWLCITTYLAVIWFCFLVIIVCGVISCVAETRNNIEMIKTGKVPTEVSYGK